MNDFYKQDMFFFISSIAVAILTAAVIVGAYYIIKILRDLKYIADKAKTETDLISEDIRELRGNVKTKGFITKIILNFFKKIFKKGLKNKTSRG